MASDVRKERIRGVPRQGALLTVSVVLLMAGPVVSWLLGKAVEDYHSSVSILFCLLTVVGGILLLRDRERRANCATGGALVLLGAAVVTNEGLLLVAAAAWTVSALGASWNKAPGFLPGKFRMPLLNLVAGALLLLVILLSLQYRTAPLYLLPRALSFAGALLLCVSVEVRTFLPQNSRAQTGGPKNLRYKSVPRDGVLTLLGGLLILASGVRQMVSIFQILGSFDVPLLNWLWPLLTMAAGIMLLLRTDREKWIVAASALLMVCQFRTLLIMREAAAPQQIRLAALLFAAELLMLLSAVGFSWNRPVAKLRMVPLLNVIAAALAAVNGIWTESSQIRIIAGYLKEGASLDSSWGQNLVLGILMQAGLVLVNLAMEGRQTLPKTWKVDGDKYRRGFGGFVGSFYTGVGGKLQLLAKIGGALCLILGLLGVAVILLGVLALLLQLFGLIPFWFEPTSLMLSGLISVVSALILAVGTWPLYAFGQITADLHAIRKGGISAAAPVPDGPETEPAGQPAARDNPDELPEL